MFGSPQREKLTISPPIESVKEVSIRKTEAAAVPIRLTFRKPNSEASGPVKSPTRFQLNICRLKIQAMVVDEAFCSLRNPENSMEKERDIIGTRACSERNISEK